MKRPPVLSIVLIWVFLLPSAILADGYIADHTVSKEDVLRGIPQWAIEAAKDNLHIAYFHSSHGSRVISGMRGLRNYKAGDSDLYGFTEDGIPVSGKLDIDDDDESGNDLSAKDDVESNGHTQWFNETVTYLDDPSHSHINVVMWSWCDPSPHDHQKYIDDMETLISMYGPGGTKIGTGTGHTKQIPVTFVFMTGHPNGDGESAKETGAYHCHKLVRDHCIRNNRFCLDYWDIETHGMDDTYYPYADDDGVDYAASPLFHFYKAWQESHPGEYFKNECDHCSGDQELTCNRMAYASWWLWARLAGWGECIEPPSQLNAQANPEVPQIVLSWTHDASTSADSFIIQRQANDEAWIDDYATVAGDITTYTDAGVAVGAYRYRVTAHLNDDGASNPCDSGTSNTVAVQIISADPPAAPSGLAASPDSQNRRIHLSWTDNAANESGFRIQRQRGSDAWEPNYAEVGENESEFTDSQLEPGEYAYRVLAFNDYDDSAATDPAVATILDLPVAPVGLTAQADPGNGTIALSWTHAGDNEAGFIIQRRVDDGAWDNLYDQTLADVLAYNDTNKDQGPLADGSYTYRVVAFNDDGQSNPSSEAVAVMTSDDDPDRDGDGTPDSEDGCPDDGDKTAPGTCGCGKPETDSDDDGTPDCEDLCPQDPDKTDPGQCGCGIPETDTCNRGPLPPVLMAPADASTGIGLSPSMSSGQFQDPDGGDTHGRTIWQISTSGDFSDLVYNETSDAHLTEFAVPEPLEAQTTYYWRVCYIDNRGAQSDWSDPFSFTTAAQDQPPDQPPADNDDNNNDDGSDEDDAFGCFIGEVAR